MAAARIVDPQVNACTWVRFEVLPDPLPGDHFIGTGTTASNDDVQNLTVPCNAGEYGCRAIPKFRMRAA